MRVLHDQHLGVMILTSKSTSSPDFISQQIMMECFGIVSSYLIRSDAEHIMDSLRWVSWSGHNQNVNNLSFIFIFLLRQLSNHAPSNQLITIQSHVIPSLIATSRDHLASDAILCTASIARLIPCSLTSSQTAGVATAGFACLMDVSFQDEHSGGKNWNPYL